ncbi:hypothetical protein BaRGS_00008543 [Batillaria attramentaria]|uniref:Uncharacterized protein n=1 Tax=Batillaria attramentaria TaxID=370345 RepID=A0ABD0LLG7_9CAEN
MSSRANARAHNALIWPGGEVLSICVRQPVFKQRITDTAGQIKSGRWEVDSLCQTRGIELIRKCEWRDRMDYRRVHPSLGLFVLGQDLICSLGGFFHAFLKDQCTKVNRPTPHITCD